MKCKCPSCGQEFGIPSIESLAEAERATLDCPHCETILIVKQGVLRDFHKYMHERNPEWPADGRNTGVISM